MYMHLADLDCEIDSSTACICGRGDPAGRGWFLEWSSFWLLIFFFFIWNLASILRWLKTFIFNDWTKNSSCPGCAFPMHADLSKYFSINFFMIIGGSY